MTDKMELWNRVSKTDPRHTKKVAQRGGFTAIDAHYQVMCATEEFGPVGHEWGYTCKHGITDDLALAWCDVTIWWDSKYKHIDGSAPVKAEFGPIRGMCKCKTGDRIDQDAGKKAMTDALTKGLSHLGFSADVFLGLFDDNKYVAQREKEEKEEDKETADKTWVVQVLMKMASTAKDVSELSSMADKVSDRISKMSADNMAYYKAEYNAIQEKLK